MKSVFTKMAVGVMPTDEDSFNLFDKIPDGSLVTVEFIKKRNYANLQRFIVFRDVSFEMQDEFDNKELWRKQLVMIAGHYDEIIQFNPKTQETSIQYWPKSISFEKEGEEEFKAIFQRSITGFVNRYGNGITEDEFKKIIQFD